ncbi:hypothetical protein [Heyndrickxia acidiproducens]|uniref:hypothetical protein n=1 Tax=Heyndrickxia acidiproducens TaxID=1121084 RepID=UPI00047738F8|nr:hypothetical protein [Heyndrickxia acidiproducens]
MDDAKKTIIVNEIKMWKNNHMIPKEYCDFLLALYNEGTDGTDKNSKGRQHLQPGKLAISSAFIFVLACIAVFVIYFTELHFILQTVILTGFVGILLFLGIHYSNKEFFYPLFYIGAAIILLFLTVLVNERLFGNHPHTLYALLFFHCALWFFVGKTCKLAFFTISGVLGAVVLIISIVI